MADHIPDPMDGWPTQDDDRVRGALLSLRADVDATPIPEPRFVRARGDARRRRLMVASAGAVAAAVVAVGALGFHGLGREDAIPPPVPATPTPTSTPSPSRSTPATGPSATAPPTATAITTPRPTGSATPTTSPRATSGGSTTQPRTNSTRGTAPTVLTNGTPRVPSSLFLTVEQWNAASTLGKVGNIVPEEDWTPPLTDCDPNADFTPLGVAWFKAGKESSWWAGQRIQVGNLQTNGPTTASEPAAIIWAMQSDPACKAQTEPKVTIKPGSRKGTAAVTSEQTGILPNTDLIGSVAMRDGEHVATFVIKNTEADQAAWQFLHNLMDAAAKR